MARAAARRPEIQYAHCLLALVKVCTLLTQKPQVNAGPEDVGKGTRLDDNIPEHVQIQ